MKSKNIISISLLFICCTVLAFSMTFYIISRNIVRKNISRNIENTTSSVAVISKYTVGEFNGKIAVYYNDSVLPDEIYDSYLENLPPEDAKKLNIGITVYTKEEVQKLIEDYTS